MRKKTHEEFSHALQAINHNIIVLGKYLGNKEHIDCECKVCGYRWSPVPSNLLSGRGCPKCNGRCFRSHEQFCEDVAKVNPNIKIVGKYINTATKISVECKVCGYKWNQCGRELLQGTGCIKCRNKYLSYIFRKPLDVFIADLERVNDKIIVTGEYINAHTPINCRCLVCGNEWANTPNRLLNGNGCPKCNLMKIHDRCALTHDEFIKRVHDINPSIKIVGKYYNNYTNIECRCGVCGNTWITKSANLIYNNNGCPKCKSSHGEKELNNILDDYNINYENQYIIDGCTYVGNLKFDAYDLDNNICYEYQGEQHYIPVDFAGKGEEWAKENLKLNQARDNAKREYCKEHGIPLIEIPYWERDNMRDFLIDKWKELNLNIA